MLDFGIKMIGLFKIYPSEDDTPSLGKMEFKWHDKKRKLCYFRDIAIDIIVAILTYLSHP